MTTSPVLSGKVLDVPAIADLATGQTQFMRAVAYTAAIRGDTLIVPAAALMEAAAQLHSAGVSELHWLVDSAHVVVDPVTAVSAFAAAAEAAQHHHGDLVCGHVGAVARARHWPIITSSSRGPEWTKAGHRVNLLP